MTEQERQDLQQQAEYGRKVEAAQEFLGDFLLRERTQTIFRLENCNADNIQELQSMVLYLQCLSSFEKNMNAFIEIGELAEKELNENGQ